MKKVIVSMLCGVFLLSATICSAKGRGIIRLRSLVQESDVILVGVMAADRNADANQAMTLHPVRILKGAASDGRIIRVNLPVSFQTNCSGIVTFKPVTAVWFLKAEEGNRYSLLPDSMPDPCFPEMALIESSTEVDEAVRDATQLNSTVDKVAWEVDAEVRRTGGYGPIAISEDELFLGGSSRATQETIYRKWIESNSDQVRMLGLVGLLAIGDAATVQSLADGRQDFNSIDLPKKYWLNGEYHSLRWQTASGNTTYHFSVATALSVITMPDTPTVHALGAIAKDVNQELDLRHSAARALSRFHSQDAVRELSTLLSSDQTDLRAEALTGISDYALGVPPDGSGTKTFASLMNSSTASSDPELKAHVVFGTPQITKENEKYFLQYWSNWCKAHVPAN